MPDPVKQKGNFNLLEIKYVNRLNLFTNRPVKILKNKRPWSKK